VIAPYFVKTFVPMIQSEIDYDCASFLGVHYIGGIQNKMFYHSLDVPEWHETPERYYRSTSPMNMIKTSIVKQVRYADIRNTEDHEFSKRLMSSGLLRTEFKIPDRPIYHYVDGVKADRERWNYTWNGDSLSFYRQPDPLLFTSSTASGNVVYPFLNLSR
jgi:hypothetical protein